VAEHEGDRSFEALVAQNDLLRVENASLAAEIELLTRKIAELEQRLKKSSRNSSLPPSSDSPGERAEARQSRAERRAEERRQAKEAVRRRGKQPGAEGQHLARRVDPDEIVVHEPEHRSSCAKELSSSQAEGFEARQVFDVPDPRLICTEHRSMRRRCSCGTVTTGTFPPEAKAPTCYGPNVRAATLYLLHGQHLSVERAAEAISAMLGATVSTGFVASLAGEAAGGLVGFLGEVRERLRRAAVVHVDETPDQVRTDTWWFHVVANEAYTYLVASPTRGRAAPDEAGVLTDFAGLMVHDLKGPETCLSGLTRHDATGQARPPWPCPLSTVCSDASSRFFVSTGPIPRRKMQRSSCSATSWPCFAAKSPVPASPGPTARSSLCLPVSSRGNAGSRSSSRRRRSLAGTARSSAGAGPTRTGGRAARLFRTRPSS